MKKATPLALFALLALQGCSGEQSALDPKGPLADDLAWLIGAFTIVASVIWASVMLALVYALLRRGRERTRLEDLDPGLERRHMTVVAILAAATALTVLILTGVSYSAQRQLIADPSDALTIKITGERWWWRVAYENEGNPSRAVTTANEVHVPVGRSVRLKLTSADVIHSFWAPNIGGKQDLLPGQENYLRFSVRQPGVYRGQCAEFCGLQHAHMGVLVVAHEPEEFERWLDAQIAPAQAPDNADAQSGKDAFLQEPCMMCHTIRGTPAGGKVGPDLTHFGSRKTIAAGTLPMSRGNIAAWIVDPHGVKPGVNMPTIKLEPEQVNSIAAFLESLK